MSFGRKGLFLTLSLTVVLCGQWANIWAQTAGFAYVANHENQTLCSNPISLNADTWTPIGPAPLVNGTTSYSEATSGRIAALAAHPTIPDILYIAAAGGGVWKTVDAGACW